MTKPKPSLVFNLFSNVSGYIVAVVVQLLLTPVVIGSLGDVRYGAWALLGQLTGYYGLLDMGIRVAVSHYVARYLASEEPQNLNKTVCSAFWVLACLACVAILGGIVLAIAAPSIFDLNTINSVEIQIVIVVMSFTIGLNLPMAVFHSVLIGNQRFDLVNLIEVSTRIFGAIAIYVVLTWGGGGLVELSLIHAGTSLVTWICMVAVTRHVAGNLNFRPRWFAWTSVKELFSYGIKNSLIYISMAVINRTDLVVVGFFLGLKWVTFYRIGEALIKYGWDACSVLARVFTPRFTQLYVEEKHEVLEKDFLRGTRLIGFFAVCLTVNLIFFGKAFIVLWLGSTYVVGEWSWRSDTVLIILAFANLPRLLQVLSWQLLFATRKQRPLMIATLLEAAANIVLSIIFVQLFGLIGVALGTLIPLYFANVIFLPAYVLRTFQIPWRHYALHGVGKPLLVGGLVGFIDFIILGMVELNTWPIFLAIVTVSVLVSIMLSGLIGLSAHERKTAISRFFSFKRLIRA